MSEQAAPTARGRCLCGAVRYELRGPLRPVVACHCNMCRRTSGHFAAATAARRKGGERITVDSIWRTNALGAAALSKMDCLGPARNNCPDLACPSPLKAGIRAAS